MNGPLLYISAMTRRAKPGDPARAIAYLRVSTDEQRLGPQAQRADIERWAAQERVAVLQWFVDEGVSGGNELEQRPGLLAAIKALQPERAGVLAIAKRDRLARDVVVAATIDRAVRGQGARVLCADGTGNGDGPTEEFLRTILDGAAAYERALIRQRTKAALAVKSARGERVGGRVRYGYDVDEKGRLVPREDEQKMIARVKELRAAGRSFRGIVADLAVEGWRSRVGKRFQLGQVQKIIRNFDAVLGTMEIAYFHSRER